MATKLWMAPLHGLTNFEFRNIWLSHFDNIDEIITPFISLMEGKSIKRERLKDFLPENNQIIKPIPQVIGNKPEQFIVMAKSLSEFGYDTFNLNLGCPAGPVVKHRRGAGMLPNPDMILRMLNEFYSKTNYKLSVKIRIGLKSFEEIMPVIDVLNQFPLKFVCIHPRFGVQFYDGNVHLDLFEKCTQLLNHRIIYSGDINSKLDFENLQTKFPNISDWMIGRKLIINPFLPSQIKGTTEEDNNNLKIKFSNFYYELSQTMRESKIDDKHTLNKCKELWTYFIQNTKYKPIEYNLMLRSNNWNEFQNYAKYIIEQMNFKE